MRTSILALCIPVGLLAANQAQATRLIFESDTGGAAVSPNYGDNVTASTQDGYNYGVEAGPTPNVEVEYLGAPTPWSTDYGDLINVIYDFNDSTNLVVRLIADPGYNVALHSFEMAGYQADFEEVPVTVTDGNGASLFSYTGHIEGNSAAHTDFDFGIPLVAPEIRISFDDSVQHEYIGIDNIVFSQQLVPEPAAGVLALTGVAGLMLRRRR